MGKPLSSRIMIEEVSPEIDGGVFPIKRVTGERVNVQANVFADGHDEIRVAVLYKRAGDGAWRSAPMRALGNDRWEGAFTVERIGPWLYTVAARVDHFATWLHGTDKKYAAGLDLRVDLAVGARMLLDMAKHAQGDSARKLRAHARRMEKAKDVAGTMALLNDGGFIAFVQGERDKGEWERYAKELAIVVERPKALFSSWYEVFPRSCGKGGKHGTFRDCIAHLPEIAGMGFDVLYFPPIHPIGRTNRKGKNNALAASRTDPGSPWAIGAAAGGHTALEPALGTMDDLKKLVKAAAKLGIDVALDIAFQCSPDHPYVKEHPEWFSFRPDGSIQFAENPPKKYEDIVPFNFDTGRWRELWEELRDVLFFWIDKGIRIFRVDNPHTKPFLFWDWLIAEVRRKHPDVIFLAEAFTRPHVMYRLAKGGFSQSYTYFTWRNTKQEFVDYMRELTTTGVAEYFRPNFWPNTPDILPEHLQRGGRPAFIMRAVMAATLSSNYGVYAPAFELCVGAAVPGKEEYLDSEKYEIKEWDRGKEGHIRDVLTRLNKIRRENPALQQTRSIRMCAVDNDQLLAYYKATEDRSNIILVVVNLDPYHTHSGNLRLPLEEMGIDGEPPFAARDLLGGESYVWQGETSYIELDPHRYPAHVIRIDPHVRREEDFDQYR